MMKSKNKSKMFSFIIIHFAFSLAYIKNSLDLSPSYKSLFYKLPSPKAGPPLFQFSRATIYNLLPVRNDLQSG